MLQFELILDLIFIQASPRVATLANESGQEGGGGKGASEGSQGEQEDDTPEYVR